MRYRSNVFAGGFLAIVAAISLAGLGCTSKPEVAVKEPPPPAASSVTIKLPPPPPPGHLARRDVDRVLLERGIPWILRHVQREEVLQSDGKFLGWRLTGLPEEWNRIDLQPGDVLTAINGLPIENPDQVWEVWKTVAGSPTITFALVRDSSPRRLVVPIDGPVDPSTRAALEKGPSGPPRAAAAPVESMSIGGPSTEAAEGDAY